MIHTNQSDSHTNRRNRLVCAMASVMYHFDNPQTDIRALKNAGMEDIMFDFGAFAPMELLSADDKKLRANGFQPEFARRTYERLTEALSAQGICAPIARLPFVDVQISVDSVKYRKRIIQMNAECMDACVRLGCRAVIVQPLMTGAGEDAWEINREFYLMLASRCQGSGIMILLTNQGRSQGGHVVRGICSDGVAAARWVDDLNVIAGEGRFGFCLDLGVCNLCGQDMQRMCAALGERIHAVVLSENDGRAMARLLPFTVAFRQHSVMDWLGAIRGLREAAFDGFLILDTTDTALSFSPLLRYGLFPTYRAMLNYFAMQINIERDLKRFSDIVLFGAGNMCRNYMKCYGGQYPPLFTCDNNPKLWGTEFEGLEIKNPEALKKLAKDCGVVICNTYYQEIAAQLRDMGIENIGYFNDEYMPSFYFDRLDREEKGC